MAHGGRIPDKEVRKMVEDRDGKLLKDEMVNGKRFITIECNKDGHVWRKALSSFKGGTWCKECYKQSKIRRVDIREVKCFLENNNLKLLTFNDVSYWSFIEVYCPKHDNTWITTFARLKRGYMCKYCGSGTPGWDEINPVLEELNFEFVERLYRVGTIRNIKLRCLTHNHVWTTNFHDILKKDRICYYCARENRKTPFEKIKARVEGRGGILITEDCVGSKTPIIIQCKRKHQWTTTYDGINSKESWCPICRSKEQEKVYEIICSLFPDHEVRYNFRGFKWLQTENSKGHPMEIDIWVPSLKIAIEYDGVQHFKPVKFSKDMTDKQAIENLKNCQARDEIKNQLVGEHKHIVKYFMRFNYNDTITEELVVNKLTEKKVLLPLP